MGQWKINWKLLFRVGVQGLGDLGDLGVSFGVWASGFWDLRLKGLGFWGFRVWGLGFGLQGFGFVVWDSGIEIFTLETFRKLQGPLLLKGFYNEDQSIWAPTLVSAYAW